MNKHGVPSGTKEYTRARYLKKKAENPEWYQKRIEYSRAYRIAHPEKRISKEVVNRYRANRRRRVIEHYGAICKCCGEAEYAFLSLDHVNEDGAEHRKTIPGRDIVGWVKRNNYPDSIQVLCYNCNFSKHHGGCPHQARLN